MPTNVTSMLKYGTNLLQAVGLFWGHYIIVVAFMSVESSPDSSMLPDYVQSSDVALDSKDSVIIEGSSRISLECPISALISITMWTKTLEDQPSAALIVLKEVAEDVSDVIIFVDGSCKVMLENDNDVDDLHDKILNCEKDGSEQPESAKGVPILLDLTQDDNRVDAMESIEIEDRKPHVANLQIESVAINLPITRIEKYSWSQSKCCFLYGR